MPERSSVFLERKIAKCQYAVNLCLLTQKCILGISCDIVSLNIDSDISSKDVHKDSIYMSDKLKTVKLSNNKGISMQVMVYLCNEKLLHSK
jgi:hypothetical protein